MKDGRISNPVILEIDPEVILWRDTLYSNMNATIHRIRPNIGETLADFKQIHFQSVKARKHFDLPEEEWPYFQAEILVKNFIPIEYIKNIGNFGIPVPSKPQGITNQKSIYSSDYKKYAYCVYLYDRPIYFHESQTQL